MVCPGFPLDVYITEYGVADVRGQSDAEVIKRLLVIPDSWFQDELLARAKANGKIDKDYQIPASQRFFTGGDTSVRGFGYETLSTQDANGKLIGSQYLNVASLDYSIKVRAAWRAAVFVDTGRAFNSKDEEWHKAAGIGVRWLSPIGQIRIDLALPIDEPDVDWRLHIFMGPPL